MAKTTYIKKLLEAADYLSGNTELKEVEIILRDIALQAENDNTRSLSVIELIDKRAYVASILWSVEDVRQQIQARIGTEATDEVILAVLDQLDKGEMENPQHGFDVIDNTIDCLIEKGVIKK